MITTEELKQLLREADYEPVHTGPADTEELWEDPAGHVVAFHDAVKTALNRCTCCGEVNDGVSSACLARHENKDCNCFPQKQTQEAGCDNTASNSAS